MSLRNTIQISFCILAAIILSSCGSGPSSSGSGGDAGGGNNGGGGGAPAGPITWTRSTDPFPGISSVDFSTLVVGSNGTVYVGGNVGIAKSTDFGSTWQPVPNPSSASTRVTALTLNNAGELVAAVGDSATPGIYRLTMAGWVQASIPELVNAVCIKFCHDRTGAIVACTTRADIFHSTDGGSTFSKIANVALSQGALWSVAMAPDGMLWTGGELSSGIYRSADDGKTWTQAGLSSSDGWVHNLLAIAFTKSGETIASRDYGQYGVEVLHNSAWTVIGNGLDSYKTTTAIAVNSSSGTMYLGQALAYGSGSVFSSSDNGASWHGASTGFNQSGVGGIEFLPNGRMIMVARGGAVWTTTGPAP